MKFLSIFTVAAILACPLLTSCTSMRAGNPVKAGFDVEEPSWAVRYIPGLKALSDFVPPPTEARVKWDKWQQKKDRQSDATEKLP
jgi:hypothetical protein